MSKRPFVPGHRIGSVSFKAGTLQCRTCKPPAGVVSVELEPRGTVHDRLADEWLAHRKANGSTGNDLVKDLWISSLGTSKLSPAERGKMGAQAAAAKWRAVGGKRRQGKAK